MMDDMDAIVVGAGMAGNAAALKMAQEGLDVLLVDRGKPIGSKNLSGGVLWGHDIAEILGEDWYEDAPVERPITRKGVQMLTENRSLQIELNSDDWREPPYNGFGVLRAKFDPWFAEQVEEAGGMVVEGINVESVARNDDGQVVGIEQAGDVIEAPIVVIADGANSRLTMDMGLRGKLPRDRYVLGVKEIVELGRDTIEERWNLQGPMDGVAQEYVCGWLGDSGKAGGFLYTNDETVSLGVVINIDSIWERGTFAHEIMEQFRLHPNIEPKLEGGELVEYGAHLVPEGGHDVMPQLYGDGFMVVGDAAGFCYSNGLVIQGMNYAIKSGIMAAETAVEAVEEGDPTAATLARYEKRLENSYIFEDFENFEGMDEFVWDDNIHGTIPHLATSVFQRLITQDGTPKEKVRSMVLDEMKKQDAGKISLARTMMKGARTI